LRELGYEITPGRSGAPEIKGYSQEYLDASSQRQNQILSHMQQNGLSGYEAAEIAAHATRDKKQIQSPAEVLAAHRKLATEFGNQPNQVVAAARERAEKKSVERAPERAQKAAQEAVTFARERSFEREAVTDERALFRDALRRGMGETTYGQVRASVEARLTSIRRKQSKLSTTAQPMRAGRLPRDGRLPACQFPQESPPPIHAAGERAILPHPPCGVVRPCGSIAAPLSPHRALRW
jgi:hypothetical protein